MDKVQITKSETHLDKFRVILNVTDEFSVGSILTRGELKILLNSIKETLETE